MKSGSPVQPLCQLSERQEWQLPTLRKEPVAALKARMRWGVRTDPPGGEQRRPRAPQPQTRHLPEQDPTVAIQAGSASEARVSLETARI